MVPETDRNITVLIVDDDENNLQLTAKAVHSAGYEVILARDGISALEITESIIPDAVLLDIMMPGMDGLEVCRKMKDNPALSDTPVIFLSAAGEEEKIEPGLDSGGADFVSKPVSNRVLLARLHSHIQRGMLQKTLGEKNQELHLKNQSLAENKAYLQAIIEGSPVPQYVIDKQHHILSWNRAMEKYSGISRSDILGTDRHWSAFYPHPRPCLADLLLDGAITDLDQYYGNNISRSLFHDGAYEGLEFFPGNNNTGRWLLFTASPVIDESGQIIGAVETVIDLSDQKRAEESLHQVVQKLQLLSGITRHDILNKITSLFGYLALIREQIPGSEPMEYIDRAKEIIGIIQDQITFTRDYQEIGINSPEWQNIESIMKRVTGSLDTRSVSVTCDLKDLELYADPLLERVFYNLVENSLRHGIDITSIRLSVKHQGDRVTLVYEDNGGGVPDAEKENIFLRKYFKHSGFGLFLSRDILQITGFSIRECGVFRTGVRFEITVPNGYFRYSPNS